MIKYTDLISLSEKVPMFRFCNKWPDGRLDVYYDTLSKEI